MKQILLAVDKKQKYTDKLPGIISLMEINNNRCQGADQQSANYLYRSMEMFQYIAYSVADAEDDKVIAYWLEHSDERIALDNEKAELIRKVNAIKEEAAAIKNDSIAENEAKLAAMKSDAEEYLLSEYNTENDKLKALCKELNSLGLFKRAEKKELQAKINAQTEVVESLEKKRDEYKQSADESIEKLNALVKEMQDNLAAQKDAVLNNAKPLSDRIAEIDRKIKHPVK